jgi:hypothetical protein
MQSGDLVFSYIGREGNPISAVTAGYRGARVNHVGVAVRNALGTFVLEAFPPEVRLTHFDVFARRSHDRSGTERLLFARLKSGHKELIEPAIRYGLDELVVDMFKHANGGDEFFAETPMSFRDDATGRIHPDWVAYYAYFGLAVPDGKPGSNPGDISLDARLDIYEVRGDIPGYRR